MIRLKRIYDEYSPHDGYRVFVDRLWARGVRKENAHIDLWLKDLAPTARLRQWFDHEPKKWREFRTRYRAELKNNPVVEVLRDLAERQATVTLLFGARDEQHAHARVIKEWLETK